MSVRRTLTLFVLVAALLLASGCARLRKKPKTPPPVAMAPTIVIPELPPSGPPPPITSEPDRPLPTPAETAENEAPPKPAPKPPKRITRRVTPPPPEQPKKNVPENTEPLQPGPLTAQNSSPQGALQQRVDTAQLLQGTENILKGINRSLNGDEQAIVQHIHSYMQQSRSATNDGDSELAYKLAVKAHLMADELAKR